MEKDRLKERDPFRSAAKCATMRDGNREIRMADRQLAFALAGLGGFNAHGAGFLQAARDNGVEPDLVTATSGQIIVLAAYLRGEPDLKAGLIDQAIERNPLAQLKILLTGYKGVFEPAFWEAARRILTPPWFEPDFASLADKFLPAQLYKPTRSPETIAALAQTFNDSDVGVVFNTFDPDSGTGLLYGNDAARDRMPTATSIGVLPNQQSRDPKITRKSAAEQAILPITEAAVSSALWLSLYGFDPAAMPQRQMDGAYHRSCILSELHDFDRVIVCRPLANGWREQDWPKSYFDVQDWNTEMWFSVGYKAEADAMKRINALIDRGAICPEAGLKAVDLLEVEPTTPAGYFNYFIERESVYEDARARADALFKWLAGGKVGPRPMAS